MAIFTDIFEDVTKYGKKIPTSEYLESGKYPIIDQGQNDIAGYTNEEQGLFTDVPVVIFGDHTRAVKFVDTPFFLGADGVKVLKSKINDVNYKYLYYAVSAVRIPNTGYNRHFKWLKEADIPIPSTEQQLETVKALDEVANLIALHNDQLTKLDELVKARFVEMFGDPNTNMMRWRKEQLQLNAILLNGRAYKQDELLDEGKYPVLRVGNFFSNRGWYYSDLELEGDKYCDNGDLLYAWSASFGPKIWDGGKVIYHYHIWKVLVGEKYNKKFLCHLLDYATSSFMRDSHGIGMMHLTKSGMEQTEFIVPPMELQEQFASFVEQVDKSKFAVQQSLDKLETLKKSLLQKYFG